MKYDYLIVGSGLFGATFAHLAMKQGKKCVKKDNGFIVNLCHIKIWIYICELYDTA